MILLSQSERPNAYGRARLTLCGAGVIKIHHSRWGRGAVGSAPRWHRGGRGFESLRLHQSFIEFSINQDTGEPSLIQNVDTRGIHTRTFALDSSGKILVAANRMELPVREAKGVRTVPAGLAGFRVRDDGKLDSARKYDVAVGGRNMFCMGITALPRMVDSSCWRISTSASVLCRRSLQHHRYCPFPCRRQPAGTDKAGGCDPQFHS